MVEKIVAAAYLLLGLLAFRLIWGFIGTRHARFREFMRGPAHTLAYVRSLASARPPHYAGHNPLGAIAVIGLITLGLASGITGWLMYEEVGGATMEELHEVIPEAMLVLVVCHIAGILFASWRHRENLIRAMITGRKQGDSRDAIPGTRAGVAALLGAALLGALAWGGYHRLTAVDGSNDDATPLPQVEAAEDN